MSDYDSRDDVRQADDINDDGVLEGDDTLDSDRVEDPLDTGIAPADRWSGADRFGTTPAEEAAGESLDQRLAEELPEPAVPEDDGIGDCEGTDGELLDNEVGSARSGRLVAPDEGAHEDEESALVATDVGIDGAAASAEEAAMHIVDEETLSG